MKTKSLVPIVLASSLSLTAAASMAATPLDLLGDPAPPAAATRTITITPDTRHVNVAGGEIVTFDVGGRSFAWNFNGAGNVMAFDLNRVAPSGVLSHGVTAYVSPNPVYLAW